MKFVPACAWRVRVCMEEGRRDRYQISNPAKSVEYYTIAAIDTFEG